MAVTAKSLADGQVTPTKTTVYTTPASTKTYIKYFALSNTAATTETVTVYVKRSGSVSRRIARANLLQDQQLIAIDKDEVLTLSAGDEIEAETNNASAVDYVMTGAEDA